MSEKLLKLKNDLEYFSYNMLRVRPKAGGQLIPMRLNPTQKYIHDIIEKQKRETGKVRALVGKARQHGVSTYVAARYYHQASMNKGLNVFIMAHSQDSTSTLFSIVDTFHRSNKIAPQTAVSNAKQLYFDKLHSSYTVATAGQKSGGRGKSINLYHGSEVAYWNNDTEHFASSIQTVPDAVGTEIILESTGNGPKGEFYERWQDAIHGNGEYIPIFIPWFFLPEYSRLDLVTPDYELSEEERELKDIYNLDIPQLAWRRNKKHELRSEKKFMQEYPSCAEEIFQTMDSETFIDSFSIIKARKKKDIIGGGPLIMGVDPAGPGGDRFAIAIRQGYVCHAIETRSKMSSMVAIRWLFDRIDHWKPDVIFIDAGGMGESIISVLKTMRKDMPSLIKAVNFGSPSEQRTARPNIPGPKNRRVEMWMRLKEWIECEEGVSIPDKDSLHSDLLAPTVSLDVSNNTVMESKVNMKKRNIKSPDEGDALALTFATKNLFVLQEKKVDIRKDIPVYVPDTNNYNPRSWMG